jgi:hypothetical protein
MKSAELSDGLPDPTNPIDPSVEQEQILSEIKDLIEQVDDGTTFAIGGDVAIAGQVDEAMEVCMKSGGFLSSFPVSIRFDEPDDTSSKLTLPLTGHDEASETAILERLVKACAPASFGRGGEDVFDESYRKAGKLDPAKFMTDFCPYQAGIIDAISQAFSKNPLWIQEIRHGITARLYKLNVYSGPSGHFKSHVDTPRSVHQFGSLVVCLPVRFQGGELQVRHRGHTVPFDFSSASTDVISWAAFYSDCEHEVLEVTSGHRITLTYNLFVSTFSPSNLTGLWSPSIDAKQVPVYHLLKKGLKLASFFPGGRILASMLSHSYAHTAKHELPLLPQSPKGSDMILYEVCRALGLAAYIRPMSQNLMTQLRYGDSNMDPFEDDFIEAPEDDNEDDSVDACIMGMRFTSLKFGDGYGQIADNLRNDFGVPRTWSRGGLVEGDKTTWLRDRGHKEPQRVLLTVSRFEVLT